MANKIKIIDASGSRLLKKPRINATDIITNTDGELLTVTTANGVNRVDGSGNHVTSQSNHSVVIGGHCSHIDGSSSCSAVLGGICSQILNSSDSVIIGGNNLTLNNQNETVLVPNFIVSGNLSAAGLPTSPGASGTLYVDGDGFVKRA